MSLKFGKLSGGDVKLSMDDDGHVRGRVRVRDFFQRTSGQISGLERTFWNWAVEPVGWTSDGATSCPAIVNVNRGLRSGCESVLGAGEGCMHCMACNVAKFQSHVMLYI